MSDEIPHKPVLKKREIERDPEGRFERHGKAISKTAKKAKSGNKAMLKSAVIAKLTEINKQTNIQQPNATTIAAMNEIIGKGKRGPGRPKGSQNKVALGLKEAILAAADDAGGQEGLRGYLRVLAIENSSAFAGLLGKVLPSTLAVSDPSGGQTKGITFERVIVWPDGHREIEGVTPKQLAPPVERFPDASQKADDDEQTE